MKNKPIEAGRYIRLRNPYIRYELRK